MEELIVTENEIVAPGRTMSTKATLFRDGTLKLKNTSKSVNFNRGLRGHSFYAVIIQDGKALYLSSPHYPPTVASQGDPFGDSRVIRTYTESIPGPIAEVANRIDVIHNSGDLHGQWDRHVVTIKRTVRDSTEISEDIKKLIEVWES